VVSALTGSATNGGLSDVLPLILAVVFLGMAGFAIVRSRTN
jgi:hypothetical protein